MNKTANQRESAFVLPRSSRFGLDPLLGQQRLVPDSAENSQHGTHCKTFVISDHDHRLRLRVCKLLNTGWEQFLQMFSIPTLTCEV